MRKERARFNYEKATEHSQNKHADYEVLFYECRVQRISRKRFDERWVEIVVKRAEKQKDVLQIIGVIFYVWIATAECLEASLP